MKAGSLKSPPLLLTCTACCPGDKRGNRKRTKRELSRASPPDKTVSETRTAKEVKGRKPEPDTSISAPPPEKASDGVTDRMVGIGWY
jgi:hypothetical protein